MELNMDDIWIIVDGDDRIDVLDHDPDDVMYSFGGAAYNAGYNIEDSKEIAMWLAGHLNISYAECLRPVFRGMRKQHYIETH